MGGSRLIPVRCTYVSATDGVHDRRWVAALRSLGFEPTTLLAGPGSLELPSDPGPVLAGPMPVARRLVGTAPRVVGLSWGYDLHDLVAAADLAWLGALDHLVVDSRATLDIALDAGLDASAITVLPWGVDLAAFPLEGPRDEGIEQFARGRPVIVSLRAHEPRYRVDDIVRSFSALASGTEAVLVLGHGGSLTGELMARIESLGMTSCVLALGTLPEARLAAVLRTADAYVTASEVDGTSVTLLQAMAVGTPVVASATPGNLGWVDDGITGWTFPVGDVRALVDAVARELASPRSTVSAARLLVERAGDWSANLPRLRSALLGS